MVRWPHPSFCPSNISTFAGFRNGVHYTHCPNCNGEIKGNDLVSHLGIFWKGHPDHATLPTHHRAFLLEDIAAFIEREAQTLHAPQQHPQNNFTSPCGELHLLTLREVLCFQIRLPHFDSQPNFHKQAIPTHIENNPITLICTHTYQPTPLHRQRSSNSFRA